MSIGQDDFQQARERYDDCREAMRENHERMREDLRFSNPAAPEQWKKETTKDRDGRPTLTLDQTNQYIGQVVNDGRQNTPSIQCTPVDDKADVAAAQQINGNLRHIEYASRAAIAYDTALEHAARTGLGWLRVVPVVVDGDLNYQEPRVFSVHDPLSVCIDGDSVEFDGSDAMFGFAETTMTERAFKRKYPKAKPQSFETSAGWCSEKGIRIAEYFRVDESKVSKLQVQNPQTGDVDLMTEDDYWRACKAVGMKLPLASDERVDSVARTVKWFKMNGQEFLEDPTEFPAEWIGLVPVYGHVLWVDGKRYVCGLTRRLMDGQRLHNYGMSALAETLLEQPKAPFMAAARAIEGYEQHWKQLNRGNPAYLPWNDIDDEGQPVPAPIRLPPPAFPAAFASVAELGKGEMQAAVGMYKSVLGQQSNSVSGRAKMADKIEGDTATFHYVDNQRRSMEHMGRILLQMQAKLIDTKRRLRILGDQDKVSFVDADPDMPEAAQRDDKGKVIAVNLNVGTYDVRVKVGPSFTTVREELKQRLTDISQGNPQLAAALAPIMVKMDDMPEADRIARVCLALLPPPVQQAYHEDDTDDGANIPAAVKQQMQGMQEQLAQAHDLLSKLTTELNAANDENQEKREEAERDREIASGELAVKQTDAATRAYVAETQRMQAEAATGGALEQFAAVMAQMQATQQQTASSIAHLTSLLVPPEPEPMPPGHDEAGEIIGGLSSHGLEPHPDDFGGGPPPVGPDVNGAYPA